MKTTHWLGISIALIGTVVYAATGTNPRASADKYSAHAASNGITIGATRVNDKQVHKTLSPDVEDCCVVVEVALYPTKDGKLEVALSDFTLQVVGEEGAVKPSTAAVITKQLPYVVQLGSSNGSGAMIGPHPQLDSPTGGVSRDPVTGMPRRDPPYTRRNIPQEGGVGVGDSGSSTPPQEREIELKLSNLALPEGTTTMPVAGYLYFSVEKKKGAKYQLEYMQAGNKVVLAL